MVKLVEGVSNIVNHVLISLIDLLLLYIGLGTTVILLLMPSPLAWHHPVVTLNLGPASSQSLMGHGLPWRSLQWLTLIGCNKFQHV